MIEFFFVQTVQVVQPFKPPPPSSPAAQGGKRWGLEPSVAVELSEAIERIERFFYTIQYSNFHRA
jgi:hypothetical protein